MNNATKHLVEHANSARAMSLAQLWKEHRPATSPSMAYTRWSMRQYIARRCSWF